MCHEQGTLAGQYAEASQIANRTDIKGDSYATPENAVKTVCSGWYAKGRTRYKAGTSNKQAIRIVKRVFCEGYRTLPRYIDEHDCMSDIKSVTNGSGNIKWSKSKWVKHKSVVRNYMGSTYIFHSFPGGYKTGVDPFGYTSKKYREKWGDFCYTVAQAESGNSHVLYSGTFPVLPDKSFGVKRTYYKYGDGKKTLKNYPTQIKRVQLFLRWAGFYKGDITGRYMSGTEKAVKDFQKKVGLEANGCFGEKTLIKAKTFRK